MLFRSFLLLQHAIHSDHFKPNTQQANKPKSSQPFAFILLTPLGAPKQKYEPVKTVQGCQSWPEFQLIFWSAELGLIRHRRTKCDLCMCQGK